MDLYSRRPRPSSTPREAIADDKAGYLRAGDRQFYTGSADPERADLALRHSPSCPRHLDELVSEVHGPAATPCSRPTASRKEIEAFRDKPNRPATISPSPLALSPARR